MSKLPWLAPLCVGTVIVAGVVLLSGRTDPAYWLALLAVAPLYLAYRSYTIYAGRIKEAQRHVQQAFDLHLATAEALALAIDARGQSTHSHIRRVQGLAAGLSRAIGMSENEILGVRTAALLRDIGNLAVPEHVLSKPGPLTQEESEKIRIHPRVGAEIIATVPFPYPVAPIILSHHERWDGKGYPAGIQGEAIPRGARILAVVDYFAALTTEGPHHEVVSPEERLRQEAGKALDPLLVDTFIEILPTLKRETDTGAPPVRTHKLPAGATTTSSPAPEFSSGPAAESVFEDIALAHREIHALYEIAQAMGTSLGVADTMALISSKLTSLVPFSCCALFLHNEEHDTLRCRFATGVDAEVIQQISVKSGSGLTGWVARNRRPLVNARPSADLEAAGVTAATSLQSALVCPLEFNDRFIGTLAVYDPQTGCYTDDHRRLLDLVCQQAAAVIYNAIVFEQTQEDSLTDPLTGLPNTRFMFMHLTRELARAERLKTEVSLLIMDLDNFKDINDSFGHHIGDRALREVAGVLRAGIRPYDICVRYAGDEFIVVLSGCGAEEAERKRNELQSAISQLVFEPTPGRRLPMGISIGQAVSPHDGDLYEALLATADSRMYRNKAHRKRQLQTDHKTPAAGGDAVQEISAHELQRAAAGVL